jgi:hypothetical protein
MQNLYELGELAKAMQDGLGAVWVERLPTAAAVADGKTSWDAVEVRSVLCRYDGVFLVLSSCPERCPEKTVAHDL